MNVYRPKSVLRLILAGFVLVALPLMSALIGAAVYVDRLATQSQQAVLQAVMITQYSRMLVEQITTMERNARQYQVLGDKSLFQAYMDTHKKFQRTVARLAALPLDNAQRDQLRQLEASEQVLFSDFQGNTPGAESGKAAAEGFMSLTELAQSLLDASGRLIDREVNRMQHTAGKTRQILVWEALALIPVTLILMALFTALIARPIRQIDQAIRRLGEGEFSSEIAVTGPRDLEYLGKRLDWLRSRLFELEAEKSKFLRHVSHELKTPLTAIREGTELLADQVVGDLTDQQLEIARILRQNSIYLQKLIEDLLRFSLAHARNPTLDAKPVNMSRLIGQLATGLKPAILSKQLSLEIDTSDITIVGDEAKLKTVIDNLLSNAVKFSPVGGVVKIRLRQSSGSVTLDVSDTGPGIDPKDRQRIFDAFYQGKTVPEGHVKGSGLGLSIAREYVIAHGGSIALHSGAGPGAHFRVTLPLG